ncbi:MAG: AAA family ATPase [Lachnospiraceae bacterium]|nr:AAA family ATPase [Lachnospiraceae bacterium]
MNIKQAKQYIKDIVAIYLKKDEFGDYRIPVVRQRPVFLLGAPGVGKTAIMEQIASELNIALVNYSMTHHTRQSALGLPFIVHKTYDGHEVDISEYTMSEIIASIYDVMESSGIKEGILFLDEINCVSETLAPAMLQFLQFKTFGKYSVPEGWVIVTAGNPPEYNKSVREFDVVTYDRMKLMEVEADYSVWKEYAVDKRLHGAVLGYLETNKDDFYQIDTTVRGRGYVTARGWEDLSQILRMYEEEELQVDEALVGQYLRNDRIVREFTAYYDLYLKYVSEYCVDDILAGTISEQATERARTARFDERLSLVGIFSDRLLGAIKDTMEETNILKQILVSLKAVKTGNDPVKDMLSSVRDAREKLIAKKASSGAYSDADKRVDKAVLSFLTDSYKGALDNAGSREEAFAPVQDMFNKRKAAMQDQVESVSGMMDHAFDFCVSAFGEGSELVMLLTTLTVEKDSAAFITTFGHKKYSELSERVMVDDGTDDLMKRAVALDL